MKSEDQNTIRINKYLSSAGVCSRRDADRLTEAGRVTVNGKKIGTGERIPVDAVICLDGFTGFTPVQYQLIEELMRVCSDIYVTVTMDESQELFQP